MGNSNQTSSQRKRAREIGEAALDMDAGSERDAFVDQRCGDDQELKTLVAGYISGADDPIFDLLSSPPKSDPRLGQQAGHWRLQRKLGEGGLGVVYLAERSDGEVRQRGAIKFLKATVHSRDLELRFRDERQILANLQHPYIVRLLDGGVTPEGQLYLVMEYLEDARPLDNYCRQRQLPLQDCLSLFQKICEAVSYAHQKLVIHRDLKPGNILVSPDGTPRLLDFGVAKILDPLHRAGIEHAHSTAVQMGTERYFSPEQARQEPLDTGTDVYSLGVILYELLAGTDPYDFDRRSREHPEQIICTIDPELPSRAVARSSSVGRAAQVPGADGETTVTATPIAFDWARRQRELAGDLDAVLMQALRKDRDQRYASVAEFSADIQRHLDHLPVSARLNTLAYRIGCFWRRNRERVIAAGVVVAILIAGLATSIYQRQQAIYQRQFAVARELASYANQFLPSDPQRALALAMYAVEATFPRYQKAVPAAENALHEAIELARPGLKLQGAKGDALAFSPDGKMIATADGSTVQVWDVQTGRKLHTIDCSPGKIAIVAFSPDQTRLATGGSHQPARLWEIATGRTLRSLGSAFDDQIDISFSPDGKLLSAVEEGTARVWDLASGRVVFQLGVLDPLAAVPSESAATAQNKRSLVPLIEKNGHVEPVDGWAQNFSTSFARGSMRRRGDRSDGFVPYEPAGLSLDDIERSMHQVVGDEPIRLSWTRSNATGNPYARAIFASIWDGVAAEWDVDSGRKLLDYTHDTYQSDQEMSLLASRGDALATLQNSKITIWRVPPRGSAGRHASRSIPRFPAEVDPEFIEALEWTSSAQLANARFSSQGDRMITFDEEHGITVADLATGRIIFSTSARGAALSPDGARLATVDESRSVTVWELNPRAEPLLLPPVAQSSDLAFDPESRQIGLPRSDAGAQGSSVWDLKSGSRLLALPKDSEMSQLAFTTGGQLLTSIDEGGIVKFWDRGSGKNILAFGNRPSSSPDDEVVAGADVPQGARFALSPDGKRLATIADGAIDLWDARSGAKLFTLDEHATGPAKGGDPACLELAFVPDASRLITCFQGAANVWDISTRRLLVALQGDDPVAQMDLSKDGKRVLTIGKGAAKVWDATTGRLLLTLTANNPISTAVLGPDGRWIAGIAGSSLITWNAESGASQRTIPGQFLSVAFSPDGERLATGGLDATARVWDVATGEELLTFHDERNRVWLKPGEIPAKAHVNGLAFSPNGKVLAADSWPDLLVYTLDTKELLNLATHRLVWELTVEECMRYLHTSTCPAHL
jgi:WD40 repeat protein/serine/threonine protein kinase